MATELQARQFEAEQRFAAAIMAAPASDRASAYATAYTDLYRIFSHLQSEETTEADRVRSSVGFISPFLARDSLVVEVGAGRGHLARALAGLVREVIALDVATLAEAATFPASMRHSVFDGLNLPLATGSADVLVSDNVLEHLHPDDARHQLADSCRVLREGGLLVLLTPNRVNGPHDISALFGTVPSGLHLREYSCREIKTVLMQAGFSSVRAYLGAKGRYIPLSPELGALIEQAASLLPRRLTRSRLIRWVLPNRFTARKPISRA